VETDKKNVFFDEPMDVTVTIFQFSFDISFFLAFWVILPVTLHISSTDWRAVARFKKMHYTFDILIKFFPFFSTER